MLKTTRWWCGVSLPLAAILLAFAGSNSAQERKDKKPFEKHDASDLHGSLRDVINVGAKLFNEQGDHAGCYRLYQGSLLAVRPFLASDLQKKIDQAIANAEKMGIFADRAFELRRVLDEIRATTKSTGAKKGVAAGDKGELAGKLMFQGKPVTGGFFVTFVGGDGKKFSSAIQNDGSFRFKTPIPAGDYRIAIEPMPGETTKRPPLPPRYGAAETSGLVIRVQAGKQHVELNLVK
jgi:hypothetical protein